MANAPPQPAVSVTVESPARTILILADRVAAGFGRPYGEMADQLRRASVSVICNLAEGVGKDGADQRRFFRIARGSACESAALVEAAARIGLLPSADRAALRTLLLRVVGALTALSRQPA